MKVSDDSEKDALEVHCIGHSVLAGEQGVTGDDDTVSCYDDCKVGQQAPGRAWPSFFSPEGGAAGGLHRWP